VDNAIFFPDLALAFFLILALTVGIDEWRMMNGE
jgi:hypothetical protein